MAEARPSVNHVTSVSAPAPNRHSGPSLGRQEFTSIAEQNGFPPAFDREANRPGDSSLVARKPHTAEMDTQSDFKLPPDVMHMNGFYTIADTLHKENANSAVTCTTQSQMGEVRMSSKVAEPSNYINHGRNNLHDWTNNIAPVANDLQVQIPKQLTENDPLSVGLTEISDCVEHLSIIEDNPCGIKSDGCKHAQPLPELGSELLNDNLVNDIPLPCDGGLQKQSLEPSVRKKDKPVRAEEHTHVASASNSRREEVPSSISEFVLGHEKGHSELALHVPPDDADLDTILPNGFDASINLVPYKSELQMPDIMRLITKDLSEPYSIYTYRYFIHNWPKLCFLAMHGSVCVGAIVCKLDVHKKVVHRGYIAMLAVDENYRKHKIGSSLVRKAIRAMIRGECDEVVLETEITNKPALQLYENLGFSRDKRLFRYYLNGVDALRLKLWLR